MKTQYQAILLLISANQRSLHLIHKAIGYATQANAIESEED
jgi:hypothetical protein